jgi:pimeloyl-ACP methyl ester carboxylesterase
MRRLSTALGSARSIGLAGAAVLAATLLTPGATGATAAGRGAVPEPAAPGVARTAIPDRFASQRVIWLRCLDPNVYPGLPRDFYRLQCGTFLAPANWRDPDDGTTVTIAVSRLPASVKPARGVTFTNPGGPGEPGLELPLIFALAERTALIRTQDLYGIDVRGTGGSTNATCGGPTLQPLLDPRDRRSENLDLILDAAELVARFCAGAPGLPIGRVTTSDTVRDLDLLRRLVKAPKVNWIGYSAGTWLGAQYADAYPGTVGHFVFDSASDVSGSWKRAFDLQPMGFERRFRRDFMRWAAKYDRVFGLGATPGAVLGTYEDIRLRLTPQTPVDSAIVLDHALAGAMYSSQTFVDAAALLADLESFLAAQGSGNVAAMGAARRRIAAAPLLAAPARRGFGASAGLLAARPPAGRMPMSSDSSDAAFLAITCNDTPWPDTRTDLVHSSAELGRLFPLLGSGTVNEPCAFWQVDNPHLLPPTGAGVPPILVVQSAHDPATPLEGARRTVASLPGSRMLFVTGEGDHGLYAGGNACVDRAVELFVVSGVLPKVGATCRGKPIPSPDQARATASRQGLGTPDATPGAAPRSALRPELRPELGSELRSGAAPANPLLGLQRLRAAVRPWLTCRSGAGGGC